MLSVPVCLLTPRRWRTSTGRTCGKGSLPSILHRIASRGGYQEGEGDQDAGGDSHEDAELPGHSPHRSPPWLEGGSLEDRGQPDCGAGGPGAAGQGRGGDQTCRVTSPIYHTSPPLHGRISGAVSVVATLSATYHVGLPLHGLHPCATSAAVASTNGRLWVRHPGDPSTSPATAPVVSPGSGDGASPAPWTSWYGGEPQPSRPPSLLRIQPGVP